MMSNEEIVKQFLISIKENPERDGLKDTPRRVTKMWKELFIGYDETQKPNITTFLNSQDGITYDQLITDTGDFYSQCLSGNTEIRTTEGLFKIKDLVGEEKLVYSYDEVKECFVIAKATDIRKTKNNTEIWKLTTDKNVIYTTPDHKFLTYNKGWVEMKDLKPTDSLVVLNSILSNDYIKIETSPVRNEWRNEQQFIFEEINGKIKKNNIVKWLLYVAIFFSNILILFITQYLHTFIKNSINFYFIYKLIGDMIGKGPI